MLGVEEVMVGVEEVIEEAIVEVAGLQKDKVTIEESL